MSDIVFPTRTSITLRSLAEILASGEHARIEWDPFITDYVHQIIAAAELR